MDTLAKRFQRTRTSMYRVINEVRAQRLLEQPLEYIHAPVVRRPGHGGRDPGRRCRTPRRTRPSASRCSVPKDVPPELASLYEVPLLTKEQEQHLFRKMNFLKYKAGQAARPSCARSGKVDAAARPHRRTSSEIEDLQDAGQRRSRNC